jgi:hypothetical protein
MSTKAKCMALADEYGLDVNNYCYGSAGLVYGDWQIGLPSGYQVELDGSMMTGLSGGTSQGTWSKVWAAIYRDMQELIAAGPWVQMPETDTTPVYTREQLEGALIRYQAELAAKTDPSQESLDWYARKFEQLTKMISEAVA